MALLARWERATLNAAALDADLACEVAESASLGERTSP